ncbi:hypothetical protein [Thermococcus paralvinellae]|uniref:hypothetical protein n=1 Tax=Thermococcus paralvinellae TaxID=582419 RepID=UPI0005B27CD6|nr:hypothetical protein [Thermococcus paralvinellae]
MKSEEKKDWEIITFIAYAAVSVLGILTIFPFLAQIHFLKTLERKGLEFDFLTVLIGLLILNGALAVSVRLSNFSPTLTVLTTLIFVLWTLYIEIKV